MGLMNQDMYLAGDGGYGQGANAFAQNFMNAYTTLEQLQIQKAYKAMQEQLMAQQLEKAKREQAAAEEAANLFKPDTVSMFQPGQTGEQGLTPTGKVLYSGLMKGVNPTLEGQSVLRPTASTLPFPIESLAKATASPQMDTQAPPSLLSGGGNPMAIAPENPAFAPAQQKALSQLSDLGSISVPKQVSQQDLLRVGVMNDPSGTIQALIAASQKEKPSADTIAKAFIKATPESRAKYKETGDWRELVQGDKEPTNDFQTFKAGKSRLPGETDTAFYDRVSKLWHDQKVAEATKVGVTIQDARTQGYGKIRPVNVLDTKNNNQPMIISMNELQRSNEEEPGRYMPTGAGTQALNKTALLEDIRGNISLTRKSLANLKTEFTAPQRAQIAYVLKSGDPKSAITSFFQGSIAGTLTPDQMDYVTDLFQLHENAMAMRSVLGAGQGSDELRAAIRATIPGGNTPTKEYAGMQLQKFENTINRLGRGIPKVPLRSENSVQYDGIIEEASKRYGVPADMIKAVMGIESSMDKNAKSPKGARGLMQLLPGTFKDMGGGDITDPRDNIFAGTKYLQLLNKRYKGDWEKTLAAYNAGMGRVDKANGVPNIAETKNYVKKLMPYIRKYANSYSQKQLYASMKKAGWTDQQIIDSWSAYRNNKGVD